MARIQSNYFLKYPIAITERFPRSVMRELADRHMDNVLRVGTLETWEDFVARSIAVSFRSYLLKSTHSEKESLSVRVPATWWDHLKHDFASSSKGWQRWVANRFAPPTYRTESKEVETLVRVCPHNDYYLSERPEVHFDFLNWEDNEPKLDRSDPV